MLEDTQVPLSQQSTVPVGQPQSQEQLSPALHTPLMSVTNAVSSVIVVGALIAAASAGSPSSKWLGLIAVALASVNIFGGFAVTQRMLAMYKKKER